MFKNIDCIRLFVPDLDEALAFYRDQLGHELIWRSDTAAGLRVPQSSAEIVLQTEQPGVEVDFLVQSADEAASQFVKAGGSQVIPPFDIQIGRCAVVKDPWNNQYVMLDMSKGRLITDQEGHILGNSLIYDQAQVKTFFDRYGEREWQRLVASPADEISLHVHTHYIKKHIQTGMRVLEIGAGPGRFTQVLSSLGARIVVADISTVQLVLNRKYAAEHNFTQGIENWVQADICDLGLFDNKSFDCVVAYGGPFSYVLDQRDTALAECLRVLKPGGLLLLSVMALWGTCHRFLKGVVMDTPLEANLRILDSGDISPVTFPERSNNFMHLFRSSELRAWLETGGLKVIDLSAAGCLGVNWDSFLQEIRTNPEKWNELLDMELKASADNGCLDMGSHLIAVAQK